MHFLGQNIVIPQSTQQTLFSYPRARRGRDQARGNPSILSGVSIHAPAGGATV